ncbi:MAG: ABC transporter permease [Lentisphaeria bacterium]|nr:ABC transporter permease [Lentisphaeria bacterium]
MLQYLLRRILLAVFTLLTILLVSYCLLRIAPGDPARSNLMGSDTAGMAVDSERGGLAGNEALRRKLNLDKPLLTGFLLWMRDVVIRRDFGESATVDPGRPVADLIAERLPVTLMLNIFAVALTYLLAVPLGVLTAERAGTSFDRLCEFGVFVLYSLPVMWVGLLLQSLLCEGGVYEIFPLKGIAVEDPEQYSIWELQLQSLRHYALPVCCLAYGGFASLSRYARSGMLDVINSDYIRTARAKGVAEGMVIWKHGFRNALVTLVTLFGGLLPGLVAGSVIVEYIFNIPGMGTLSLLALSSRDYPLQMALFCFSGVLTLTGILISDLLYMAVDPRIRLSGR